MSFGRIHPAQAAAETQRLLIYTLVSERLHKRDRRRLGRCRSSMAGGRDGRARASLRNAPRDPNARAPDGQARRDSLLEFIKD